MPTAFRQTGIFPFSSEKLKQLLPNGASSSAPSDQQARPGPDQVSLLAIRDCMRTQNVDESIIKRTLEDILLHKKGSSKELGQLGTTFQSSQEAGDNNGTTVNVAEVPRMVCFQQRFLQSADDQKRSCDLKAHIYFFLYLCFIWFRWQACPSALSGLFRWFY